MAETRDKEHVLELEKTLKERYTDVSNRRRRKKREGDCYRFESRERKTSLHWEDFSLLINPLFITQLITSRMN